MQERQSKMKVHPLEEYLMTSESKSVAVLLWILKNKDDTNHLHATLGTVSEECKVTKVTVNRVFQKLYDAGFMEKVRNGKYLIHKI